MSHERRRIAAILPRGEEYSNRLLEGAVQFANEHRHVRIYDVPFTLGGDSPFSDSSHAFDGAFAWLSPRERWAVELLSQNVTVVNTNSSCRDDFPFVAFSHEAVVEMAVDHLAERRLADFAYVGFERQGEPGFERRWSLIKKATRRHSLTAKLVELASQTADGPYEWGLDPALGSENGRHLRRSLGELTLPAGVWCEEDYMGFHVCEQSRELGLRIPEDVAVLGLGDLRIARCCTPPLSSIPQPGKVIGYEAMRVLDGLLSGNLTQPKRVVLPPPAVVCRESTGGGEAAVGYVQRARQIIAEHACDGITVAEICRMTAVSKQTLTSRFHEALGHTPGEEIRRVRLDHAKRYLLTTDLSIAHIAGLCGYNEQNKFGNFFKRQTGATPSRFRRQRGSVE